MQRLHHALEENQVKQQKQALMSNKSTYRNLPENW